MKTLHQHLQHPSVKLLSFKPVQGFASPHIQTILPVILTKGGTEPPSAPFFVQLSDGDSLYCKMSTPACWTPLHKTVLLLHGLGGSDSSAYMIRLARKMYLAGHRVVRVNLRGSGQGVHYARRPYNGGTSADILDVVQTMKKQTPHSPLILIGYSLGGNILLKLLGELGEKGTELVEKGIAVCPPIDLARTMELLCQGTNQIYHRYYVKGLRLLGAPWLKNQTIHSIVEFDTHVTAPQWGFRDAHDYYAQCSGILFLSKIRTKCELILSMDDPFVDYRPVMDLAVNTDVNIWLSRYGGHMGFWGWAGLEHGWNWLDGLLFKLVSKGLLNNN